MRFKVTSPSDETFEVKVTFGKDQPEITSNRKGKWGPETQFQLADLIMPEYEFNDWDIEEIK